MYRVTVTNNQNEVTFYDDSAVDLRTKLVDPTLKVADNAAGSLEFTIYPDNWCYDDAHMLLSTSTVRVYKHGNVIWEGRPVIEDKDFYNAKAIQCEGVLAYFNDIPQPVKTYTGANGALLEIEDFVKGVLTEYNRFASANRQIDIEHSYIYPYRENYLLGNEGSGTVKMTLGAGRSTNGESTYEALLGVVSATGGHIKIVVIDGTRRLYFTAMHDPENDFFEPWNQSGAGLEQFIKYGVNLKDLTQTKNMTELCTAILPIGAEISPDNPKTITSMCTPVPASIFGWFGRSTNIYDANVVTPWDTVQYTSVEALSYPKQVQRRVCGVSFYEDSVHTPTGYDYYLFTSSCLREPSSWPSRNNSYMYYFEDVTVRDIPGHYANVRIMKREKIKSDDADRDTLVGTKFSIPNDGSYSIEFSCATYNAVYAQITNCTYKGKVLSPLYLPSSGNTVGDVYYVESVGRDYKYTGVSGSEWEDIGDQSIEEPWILPIDVTDPQKAATKYPMLYRAPYARDEIINSVSSPVDISKIHWEADNNYSSDGNRGSFGTNDIDIAKDYDWNHTGEETAYSSGYLRIVRGEFSLHSIDDPTHRPYGWNEDDKWSSGFRGHRLCRVLVEPGKTYYLNTRVTNPGYPLDDAAIGENGVVNSWAAPTCLGYAIVARRRCIDTIDPNLAFFKWDGIAYKSISRDHATTIFDMEPIKIPDALYPENIDQSAKFYNDDGTYDVDGAENTQHLELWFLCDQLYLDGSAGSNSCYKPSIYVENSTDPSVIADTSESGKNYKTHVTVAPVNPATYPAGSPYANLPREVMVNQELADKYGLIIRQVEYDKVQTPAELYKKASLYLSMLKDPNAYSVNALDLIAIGMTGYKDLWLHDKIPITSEPHGLDQIYSSLTEIEISLDDQSKNEYTFGYSTSSDLTTLQAAMEKGGS